MCDSDDSSIESEDFDDQQSEAEVEAEAEAEVEENEDDTNAEDLIEGENDDEEDEEKNEEEEEADEISPIDTTEATEAVEEISEPQIPEDDEQSQDRRHRFKVTFKKELMKQVKPQYYNFMDHEGDEEGKLLELIENCVEICAKEASQEEKEIIIEILYQNDYFNLLSLPMKINFVHSFLSKLRLSRRDSCINESLLPEITEDSVNEMIEQIINDYKEFKDERKQETLVNDLLTKRRKPAIGMYTCKRCGSTDTDSTEAQARKGDEGATTFIRCSKCKYSWNCNA